MGLKNNNSKWVIFEVFHSKFKKNATVSKILISYLIQNR